MTTTAGTEQGQLVQVRSRPWMVNEAKPTRLPSPAMGLPVARQQNLLTLSFVEGNGLRLLRPEAGAENEAIQTATDNGSCRALRMSW